jgi:hypothetical protein
VDDELKNLRGVRPADERTAFLPSIFPHAGFHRLLCGIEIIDENAVAAEFAY